MWGEGEIGGQRGVQGLDAANRGKESGLYLAEWRDMEGVPLGKDMVRFAFCKYSLAAPWSRTGREVDSETVEVPQRRWPTQGKARGMEGVFRFQRDLEDRISRSQLQG